MNRAEKLAEEYRQQGYEVLFMPDSEELPDFLKPFRPDLVVFRDEIKKVIEVKSRASLSGNPQIREMARLIQNREGWDLELSIVGIGEDIFLAEEAEPYNADDIICKTEDAKQLMDSGHAEAAFLYAWSANEAALRLLSEKEGIEIKTNSPLHIIKNLATEGVISGNDYDMLMSARNVRNAIVHGYKHRELTPRMIYELIHFTQEVMNPSESLRIA